MFSENTLSFLINILNASPKDSLTILQDALKEKTIKRSPDISIVNGKYSHAKSTIHSLFITNPSQSVLLKLLPIIPSFPNLNTISFKDVELTDKQLTDLLSAMKPNVESIENITFENNNFNEQQLKALISEYIKYANKLKHLSIKNVIFTTSAVNRFCIHALNHTLTHLYLDNCNITDGSLAIIYACLPLSLQVLSISYNKLSSLSLNKIAELLKKKKSSLLHLYLDGNSFGNGSNEDFNKFGSSLQKNNTLSMLSLSYNGITNTQFKDILNGLYKRKKLLSSLNLCGNIIGDGIEELGDYIQKSNFLLGEIDLQGNSLANTALLAFSNKLKNCKAPLKHINLANNNLQLETGFLLQSSAMENENIIHLDLSDNKACESLAEEIKTLKHLQIKSELYLVVNLAILGKSDSNCNDFKSFMEKQNTLKQSEGCNYIQLPIPKATSYYYSLQYFNRNHYSFIGSLLHNCNRIIYIVTEDLVSDKLIPRLRSWVPLINTTTRSDFSIIFAINTSTAINDNYIKRVAIQIHELITELSYHFRHVNFCSEPLFFNSNQLDNTETLSIIHKFVKMCVESKPLYLPSNLIKEMIPKMQLPLFIAKNDANSFLRNKLNININKATGILEKLLKCNLVSSLTSELYCFDTRTFHMALVQMIKAFFAKQVDNTNEYNGSEAILDSNILSVIEIPSDMQINDIYSIIIQYIEKSCIFIPLPNLSKERKKIFFPPWIKRSIFIAKSTDYIINIPNYNKKDLYYIGRRFVLPINESIPIVFWYTLQAHFIDNFHLNDDWDYFIYSDCIRIIHKFGFGFRIFFQIDQVRINSLRMLELHVIGKSIEGCSVLLDSVLAKIYEVCLFINITPNLQQLYIICPDDVETWKPGSVDNKIHLFPLGIIAKDCMDNDYYSTGINAHILAPELLTISPKTSKVKFSIVEGEIIITINVIDKFGKPRYVKDEFQVLLLSTKKDKIFCKHENTPKNICIYTHSFTNKDCYDDFILLVTLPHHPITLDCTPIPLTDTKNEERDKLLKNWKKDWEPIHEYTPLFFGPRDEYYKFRDTTIKKMINNAKIQQNYKHNKITSELEYAQICSDGCNLAKMAYTKHSDQTVTLHFLQRRVNRYSFAYKPDYKQQLKLFLYSPEVNLSLTSGKSYFYTFERGGDLYICIRGTKTKADIIADLKYSLTPYPSEENLALKKDKQEMIHDGFYRYSEILIEKFRESYSELLSTCKERRLFIFGHSLGGGIAQLISRMLIEQNWNGEIITVTIGSPLIGNIPFCNWNGWRNSPNLKIFNFANQKDPVTNLLVRSWSVFSKIGLAPKGNFGYTAKVLYVFSCNTSTLEVIEYKDVIPYLKNQVVWNPKDLGKYVATHKGFYYMYNMKKFLEEYIDPTKESIFYVP